MSKFIIECPECGRYASASTGLFASNSIKCSCGFKIKVNRDKIASKQCPSCGNMVVYDQSQGKHARCPVCKKKINESADLSNVIDFRCPSCSCHLSADRNADYYFCPLCDTKIDVQAQVAKEKIKNDGVVSVIKFEGPDDVFVWKHPIEDFNLGSQLIVHESQEAIFFKDGKALDLFGSGRYTLATQNLPLLEELYKLPTNSNEVFHSEVYFFNLATQMNVRWGTDSKVRMFDPASGLHIELGASGSFNLRMLDSRKLLLKIVGTTSEFSQNDVIGLNSGKFRPLIMNRVKANLARIIKEQNINILEIDEHLDTISDQMKTVINETLLDYGLMMPEFFVTTIVTPDDDPNFRRLKQQFAEKTLRVREEEIKKAEAEAAQGRKLVEAQTEAQMKVVDAQGEAEALKVKAQAEAEAYKLQAFAEAAEMQAKGYTYQQETARQVGLEAMQNGITGGSGGTGGSLGDLAGLGVTLGAMGSVINMTKEALNPIMGQSADLGSGFANVAAGNVPAGTQSQGVVVQQQSVTASAQPTIWNCVGCGLTGITSKFCPDCGMPRPVIKLTWDCKNCGTKEITSKFCPECGQKRDDA